MFGKSCLERQAVMAFHEVITTLWFFHAHKCLFDPHTLRKRSKAWYSHMHTEMCFPSCSPSTASLGSLLAGCQMSVLVTPCRSEGLPRRSLFPGSCLSVLGWLTVSCSIHSPRPPGNRHQIKNKNRP